MKISVRLDDVKSSGFYLGKDGPYKLRIKRHSIKRGPSGYDNIVWVGEVFGHSDPKVNGEELPIQTSLSPDALWKLKDMLENANFKWEPDGFDPDRVHGSTVGVNYTVAEVETRGGVREKRMQADSFFNLKPRRP